MIKNEEFWVGELLYSLVQFFPHVLVFDTGSTDATASIVKQFPSVTLVEKGELNKHQLGECRNEMVAMSKTDWFLQQDGDEYYPPQSLKHFMSAEMPKGKKVGFTLIWNVDWDGQNFRALNKFSRVAVLWHEAKYAGAYPYENPDLFDHRELFHYFPHEVEGFHLHKLVRSSKDAEVYLRLRKQHQFSMMNKKVEMQRVLNLPFAGSWPNPYLEYLQGKRLNVGG